ncbi:MAG TPA: protein kinase [Vicinamibacterales bacterium]|jgi:serine/threonine-protein kinase
MTGNPWMRATRTASRIQCQPGRADHLLASGEIVQSPETGLQYRVERLIGAGGFGQAYLARRIGRWRDVPALVCLKVSTRLDGWVREAYFGQVLEGHERAIRLHEAFPLLGADGGARYFLVLEYAEHGDLDAFLRRGGRGWSETAVRREIAGILAVLGKLHRGQTLHRDLTPVNVFVCAGPRLKLGDFGIVRQQSDPRGITARTMNWMTAPSEIRDRAAPKWQARDDVYQVGQLLGMLIAGDASRRLRTGDVRGLRCTDHLKEIVHRCIGERRKRYESADEMIDALRTRPAPLRPGIVRSLKGAHVTFTGIFTKTRKDVAAAAARAGALVHSGPSSQTTVIVRGRPNPLQAAGREGGLKLMEIRRLREKGQRITVLTETQFWRLAGRR